MKSEGLVEDERTAADRTGASPRGDALTGAHAAVHADRPVDKAADSIREDEVVRRDPTLDGHGLVATGLAKQFRRRRVVDGVSVSIAPGEVVGLLGPNGAGKTTSFHLILGLIPPTAGRVALDGQDITSLPMYMRARRGVGYLPQEASIFRRMSVEENLLSILEMRGIVGEQARSRTDELLHEFGLHQVARSPGYALSGGERRRAEIARALSSEPRYMLLDEPFAGIDPIAVAELQRVVVRLKKRQIGVLITDHNVRETLQITDHAYIISQGKIFREGTPSQLASDAEVRRVYLGENFRLH